MKERMIASAIAIALAGAMAVPAAFADEGANTVTYRGGDEKVTVAGSALFSQVDNGLPGDALMGALFIENGGDVPCEVSTFAEEVTAKGPDDMLGRIRYAVSRDDARPVYDGFLEDAENIDPIGLGTLEPGETMTVNYGVDIPTELTNEYADAAVGLSMVVSMTERKADAPADPGRTDGDVDVDPDSGGASIVPAGDTLVAVPFILGAFGAAGAVIWCAWKRRTRMW